MFIDQNVKRGLTLGTLTALLALSLPIAYADSVSSYNSTTTVTESVPTRQTYVVPSGTPLAVQTVGALPTTQGSSYTGEVTSPVVISGVTVIPVQSQVSGQVLSVDTTNNTENIQFNQVTLPNGDTVPIKARVTANMMVSNAEDTSQTLQASTGMSPGQKIIAGTVGGAAFGGATGALIGVISPGVYTTRHHQGTATLRGLGWGAAVGAGLGLVTGTVLAIADRNDTSTTTVQKISYKPTSPTNITSGSLEEAPATYYVAPSTFNVILDEPATVTL